MPIVKRYTVEFKAKIGAEYAQGITIYQLAKKYNIPIHTIQGWYQKGHWSEKRRDFKKKCDGLILEKLQETVVENTSGLLHTAAAGVRVCNEIISVEIEEYRRKKANRTDTFEDRERLLDMTNKCMKLGVQAAGIQSSAMPTANEEVMAKALKELEELRLVELEDAEIIQGKIKEITGPAGAPVVEKPAGAPVSEFEIAPSFHSVKVIKNG